MDVALVWDGSGADIGLTGGDLQADEGLATAVVISLLSDGRADADDVLPGGEGVLARRGWWAADSTGWGSLLWLLAREKTLPATAARAEEYARTALQWLVDDGIAATVEATAEILNAQTIAMQIIISRGKNRRYDYLWRNMQTDTYITTLKLGGGQVVVGN